MIQKRPGFIAQKFFNAVNGCRGSFHFSGHDFSLQKFGSARFTRRLESITMSLLKAKFDYSTGGLAAFAPASASIETKDYGSFRSGSHRFGLKFVFQRRTPGTFHLGNVELTNFLAVALNPQTISA